MIGVYDSGVGGMLLARTLADRHPEHRVLFYGDTSGSDLNVASTPRVVEQANSGCRFLVDQGAKLVVLACHEASALAAESLREQYTVPVIDALTVTAEAAVQVSTGGRIGLVGTRTIIASGRYQSLIATLSAGSRLHCQACPLLLPLIEEGWYNKVETKMIVKRCLRPLKDRQIDTLVPACSHYQLLLSLLAARIGRRVRVVDPFKALVEAVAGLVPVLEGNDRLPDSDRSLIHVTRRTPQVDQAMKTIFGRRSAHGEVS